MGCATRPYGSRYNDVNQSQNRGSSGKLGHAEDRMKISARATFALVVTTAFGGGCVPDGWNERVEYAQAAQARPAAEAQATQEATESERSPADPATTEPAPESQAKPEAEVAVDGTTANPVAMASGDEVPIGVEPAAETPEPVAYQETDPAALTDFHPVLEPYGTWEDDATYGTVWYPSQAQVGADFTPYSTGGHWSHDGYEYVWVSDYDWGWAPFHYGRWIYVAGHGWAWVPGRVYRGAWVSWRVGPVGYGYIGWAPLVPTWYWYRGHAYGVAVVPHAPYSFCATRDLFHPQVGHHVLTGHSVVAVAEKTRPFVDAKPGIVGTPRTFATPGIGGGARVQAKPSMGPSPSQLGMKPSQIVRTPNDQRGYSRAKQYGDPKMRSALGLPAAPARQAPAQLGHMNSGTFDAPNHGRSIGVQPPSSHSANPHFSGAPHFTEPHGAPSHVQPPHHTYRPSMPAQATPNFGHSPPSHRAFTPDHGTPSYRPSFRPSAPNVSHGAPAFRPSAPRPAYRPSSPSFRPSAPSRPSSHSSRGGSRGGRR